MKQLMVESVKAPLEPRTFTELFVERKRTYSVTRGRVFAVAREKLRAERKARLSLSAGCGL